MKRLKSGFKDRSAVPVVIDDVTYLVKPMSQEIMTGLAMFSNGIRDSIMSENDKKNFVKNHIKGWSGMFFEDGEELEYSDATAIEYLTHEDYDDLYTLLYWESVKLAGEKDSETEKNKEQAKK